MVAASFPSCPYLGAGVFKQLLKILSHICDVPGWVVIVAVEFGAKYNCVILHALLVPETASGLSNDGEVAPHEGWGLVETWDYSISYLL